MATIPLGLYLWRRIRSVGIESVMGLPGDFNLNFLDFIYDVPGLNWVGNANELNAAYAADGYARIKGVPGCLVTTHGVGELSALNGIAGAAAEHAPIIHIVGQTARKMQENHLMIHHSIGTSPDHQVYNKTSKHIRCAAAELWDAEKAPAEIDRVIREAFVQKLPVYIFMPIDLTYEKVPEHLLDTAIDVSYPVDRKQEQAALDATLAALQKSTNASVFADFLTQNHARKETREFADSLNVPLYASHMSKGVIDEDHPRYVGLYNGRVSVPGLAGAMEASDLVIALGWWPTDSNTAVFSRDIPSEKRIDVMDTHVIVQGERFDGVYMAPFLSRLTAEVKKLNLKPLTMPQLGLSNGNINGHANAHTNGVAKPENTKIQQNYIWKRIGEFLQPHDVILADTGTATFGLPDAHFPKNVTFIHQTYYGSIGYATPCALGVELALRERHAADPSTPRGRTILVTGDGSIQLTIQEVGTMIMRGLKPIIVIINNNGYTIERAIHGARAQYNDIAPYNYRYLLSLFGGETPATAAAVKGGPAPNYRCATTEAEFEAAWNEEALRDPHTTQVLEVRMDKLDIPWRLARLLKNRDSSMEGYLREEGFTNSD